MDFSKPFWSGKFFGVEGETPLHLSINLWHGCTSANLFVVDSIFSVQGEAPLHLSAGGVSRATCSPVAPEVRFHKKGVMFTVLCTGSAVGRRIPHRCHRNLRQELSAYISLHVDRSCACLFHLGVVLYYSVMYRSYNRIIPGTPELSCTGMQQS